MSKAKILFVCHDFPPFKYAGAQIYAMHLAQAINQSGAAYVEIFHPVFRVDDSTQPYGTLETTTFEDLVVHRLYKPTQNYDPANLRNELVAKAFDSFLTNHKYDLIHIHGLGQLTAVPIEIAKKHGIKTVMTVHDSWLICEEWHLVYPDQTVCSGPESIEKCANCFIKYYVQGNITPEFVQTMHDYKKIRHNYNLQMFNLLDARIAQSSFLKNTYLKYGSKSISIIPLGFTPQKPLPKTSNKKIIFGYA
ncbi:MAG TPA: glycosyltransferase, partial [Candidatus Cloacimonadota bacterium]|nr:glycosyltransferase [Candidatus Cloacimonadota bacterium]